MERTELTTEENVIKFPGDFDLPKKIPTPKSDTVIENAKKLAKISNYKTDYDFETYKRLEERFGLDQPRGGIVFGGNDPFKIINTHKSCQQCLYAFEMDTYGRGCVHDCAYCYSKAELTVHGYWNKPFPMPRDITTVWKEFYTVFETDKKIPIHREDIAELLPQIAYQNKKNNKWVLSKNIRVSSKLPFYFNGSFDLSGQMVDTIKIIYILQSIFLKCI